MSPSREGEVLVERLRKVFAGGGKRKRKHVGEVVFGVNACLRKSAKLELCIIPIKQSAALVDQIKSTLEAAGCGLVWLPEISPSDFAHVVNLPKTCAMAGLVNSTSDLANIKLEVEAFLSQSRNLLYPEEEEEEEFTPLLVQDPSHYLSPPNPKMPPTAPLEDEDVLMDSIAKVGCCDRGVCCTRRGYHLFCRFMGCRCGRGHSVRGPRDAKNLESISLQLDRTESTYDRPDNIVSSGKYTVYDFLPLATMLQFRRAVNVYFLFQVILLLVGYFAPSLFEVSYTPWGTMLVLCFVVGVTLITEAYDDYYRHVEDHRENSKPVIQIHPSTGKKQRVNWGSLTAGNFVVLRNREICPADVVVLQTDREHSVLNVETSSIDGETNLKIKQVSRELHLYIQSLGSDWMNKFAVNDARLEYEEPNSLLNFNGTFHLDKGNGEQVHLPVGFDSLVLRGSEIRNTNWVIALCVYCGPETKLVMSKRKAPPSKFSTLDLLINKIVFLAVIQSLVFTVVAVLSLFLGMPTTSDLWYMGYTDTLNAYIFPGPLAFLLTYCNFFSNLVPIDLYVTIEIANVFQSYFLSNDLQMYCAKSNTRTRTNTTSLISEIGQVTHIFSDKTGTLTQNVMRLVALALPSKGRFGFKVRSIHPVDDGKLLQQVHLGMDAPVVELFEDFIHALANGEPEATELALALVLCHNVIIDYEDDTGKIRYNAQSPDEEALVKCVSELGYKLQATDGGKYLFTAQDGVEHEYHVLASFPFSSERKPERSLDFNSQIELDLDSFAQAGLRTLLFAKREFTSSNQVNEFMQEYNLAKVQIGAERQRAMDALAERTEVDMQILGSSGIEDALQDGVADTIQMIRDGAIKLWVLTGDKVDTAINIGFTCKLITPTMHQVFLNDSAVKDEEQMDLLIAALTKASQSAPQGIDLTTQSLCLICTGSSLENILAKQNGTSESQSKFLTICEFCDVVLCCRVSPIQKALLVESVNLQYDDKSNSNRASRLWSRLRRKKRSQVTLAIGDGLNDVPMIQAAQVGVGISGKEGLQAANNADFSLAQFRFLQSLRAVTEHDLPAETALAHPQVTYNPGRLNLMLNYKAIFYSYSSFVPILWVMVIVDCTSVKWV
ncbi:hypothetical protein BASA81_005403 [Batrachochytrium salamandrivorans]|nr:hypothetical protein BASA81_005403 [Batrachochytrium salamandrivorans]